MCCRYYIEHDDPEIINLLSSVNRAALSAPIQDSSPSMLLSIVNRSPLAAMFREAGDAIVTQGEIFPSMVVPALASRRDGQPALFPMKWGFTGPGKQLLLNARAETAAGRPVFRESWHAHRCILPASWYFEWKHIPASDGKKRIIEKYAIRPEKQGATWLCGLYRAEMNLPHFVVLTREPTEDLRDIHDRMPLILPGEDLLNWINPSVSPRELLSRAVTGLTAEKQ